MESCAGNSSVAGNQSLKRHALQDKGGIWGREGISFGGKSELIKFSSKEKVMKDELKTAARCIRELCFRSGS